MSSKRQQFERSLKIVRTQHEALKQCHHYITRINSDATIQGKLIEAATSVMFVALWEMETHLDELKRLSDQEEQA